jgi:hypothetical protein
MRKVARQPYSSISTAASGGSATAAAVMPVVAAAIAAARRCANRWLTTIVPISGSAPCPHARISASEIPASAIPCATLAQKHAAVRPTPATSHATRRPKRSISRPSVRLSAADASVATV